MGEGDADYMGEDESPLPGFGLSRKNKLKDADETSDAVYHSGSAILSSETSSSHPFLHSLDSDRQ